MGKTLATLALGAGLIFGGFECPKPKNEIVKPSPIISGVVKSEHFNYNFASSDNYLFSIKTNDGKLILFDGVLDSKNLNAMINEGDSIKIRPGQRIYEEKYYAELKDIVEINGIKNPFYKEK